MKTSKKKQNKCSDCPYYDYSVDYFTGEFDEYCECHVFERDDVHCHYSLFERRILAFLYGVRQAFWDWMAERRIHREEKERLKLGMTEDEYFEYKYYSDKEGM